MINSRMDSTILTKAFLQVLGSGSYSEGEMVRSFESLVSGLYGQEAVAYNSAGTALFSVLKAIDCRHALVPNNTFYATGGMALEAGYKVTLVDCSREDFSMSLEAVKRAYTWKEDCLILTHVGGGIAHDYKAISVWCEANGLRLVEDAAHAFGVLGPSAPGTWSDAAVFSFYPTKAVPIGEGGMVVTRHNNLASELRRFRNYGKFLSDGVIRYTGRGFNFRMDEWTAAVGVHQMRRLQEILDLRNSDAEVLSRVVQPSVSWESTNWYKFIAPVQFPAMRKAGKVYQRSDQLCSIAPFAVNCTDSMPDSAWVAENHICLPIGEGMYEGKSLDEVTSYLLGES